MATTKKRDWGMIIAGVLLIICAFLFLLMPGMTLIWLTIFAGAAFLVAGVFEIISYVRNRKTGEASGWTLLYAILDIILGLMFLYQPVVMAVVLAWLVGIFVCVFGIYEIIAAFKIRKSGAGMWGWVLFSGIVSVIVAIMFFTFPASIIIYMGMFLMMRGITEIIFGFNTSNKVWM